jgi:hypothetical protein
MCEKCGITGEDGNYRIITAPKRLCRTFDYNLHKIWHIKDFNLMYDDFWITGDIEKPDCAECRKCSFRIRIIRYDFIDDLRCHQKIHEYEEQKLIRMTDKKTRIQCIVPDCPFDSHTFYIGCNQCLCFDEIRLHVEWKTISYRELKIHSHYVNYDPKKQIEDRKESCKTFYDGKLTSFSPIYILDSFIIDKILHEFLEV